MKYRIQVLVVLAGVLGALALPVASVVPISPTSSQTAQTASAAPIPGTWTPVDLAAAEEHLVGLTPDEQVEQLRDWALLAAVLQNSAGQDAAVRRLFDVPALRVDGLASLYSTRFGKGRAAPMGTRLLALTPADDQSATRVLTDLVDEYRMVHGLAPAQVVHVEYRLDAKTQSLAIRTAATIEGERFQSAAYGYVESPIRTRADLQAFLQRVGTLTFASLPADGAGLRVAGRLSGAAGAVVGVEDVAALFQAGAKERDRRLAVLNSKVEDSTERRLLLQMRPELLDPDLGFSLDPAIDHAALSGKLRLLAAGDDALYQSLLPRWRTMAVQAFMFLSAREMFGNADRGSSETSAGSDSSAELRKEVEAFTDSMLKEMLDALRTAAREHGDALQEAARAIEARDERPLTILRRYLEKGPHSTTPARRLPKYAVTDLQRMLATDDDTVTVDGQFGPGTVTALKRYQKENSLTVTGNIDEETWKSLLADHEELETGLGMLGDTVRDFAELIDAFQCPRYDGDLLRGTQVGMTFYYTDLMMKLWSFGYKDSTPPVAGFQSRSTARVSPIFWANMRDHSSTRSWLAPRIDGFDIHQTGRVLAFQPVLTRILNLSSDPLDLTKKEVEANYPSERFSSWWNQHYRDVADFEPQYYRLNELMKWATILNWLQVNEHKGLQWLGSETVDRSHRFDRWYGAQKSLQVRTPLPFLKSQSRSPECLDIIESDMFDDGESLGSLIGGVSAVDPATIRRRIAARSPEIVRERDIVRAGMDFADSRIDAKSFAISSVRKVAYEADTGAARVVIRPPKNFRLEGQQLQANVRSAGRQFTSEPQALTIEEHLDLAPLGRVRLSKEADRIRLSVEAKPMLDASKALTAFASADDPRAAITALRRAGYDILDPVDAPVWLLRKNAASDWISIGAARPDAPAGGAVLRAGMTTGRSAVNLEAKVLKVDEAKALLDNTVQTYATGLLPESAPGLIPRLQRQALPNGRSALLQWGDRQMPVHVGPHALRVPSSSITQTLSHAEAFRRTFSEADLRVLLDDLNDAAPTVVARRIAGGSEEAFLAVGTTITREQQSLVSALRAAGMPQFKAIAFKGTAVRMEKGVLLLPLAPSAADEAIARRTIALVSKDPTLAEPIGRLRRLTDPDLDLLTRLPVELRKNAAELARPEGLPPGYALVDLRVSGAQRELFFRTSQGTVSSRTLDPALSSSLDTMRTTWQGTLGKSGSTSTIDELRQATREYFGFLRETAARTKATTIVTKELNDAPDAQFVWLLHGGDAKVRFRRDQPDMERSLRNLAAAPTPNLTRNVVLSTLPADFEAANLKSFADALHDVTGGQITVNSGVTWMSFMSLLMESGSPAGDDEDEDDDDAAVGPTQIHLICRVSGNKVVFADREIEIPLVAFAAEQLGRRRDLLHIVSNDGEALLDGLGNSGRFLRVVLSPFTATDSGSLGQTLRNVVDFFARAIAPATGPPRTIDAIFEEIGIERVALSKATADPIVRANALRSFPLAKWE